MENIAHSFECTIAKAPARSGRQVSIIAIADIIIATRAAA